MTLTPFERMMLSSKSKRMQDIGKKVYKARTGKELQPPSTPPGAHRARWIPPKKHKKTNKKKESVKTESAVETSKQKIQTFMKKTGAGKTLPPSVQKTMYKPQKQNISHEEVRKKVEQLFTDLGERNKSFNVATQMMYRQDIASSLENKPLSKPITNINQSFLVRWEKPTGEIVEVLVRGNDLKENINQIKDRFNGRVLQIVGNSGTGETYYRMPSTTELQKAGMKAYTKTQFVPPEYRNRIIKEMKTKYPEKWKEYQLLGIQEEFIRKSYEKSIGIKSGETFSDIFNERAKSNKEWMERYGKFKVGESEKTWRELKQSEPALYLEKTKEGYYTPTYDYKKWMNEYKKKGIEQVGEPLYSAHLFSLGLLEAPEPAFWSNIITGKGKEYVSQKIYYTHKDILSGKKIKTWLELQEPAYQNIILPFVTVAAGASAFGALGAFGKGGEILAKGLPVVLGTAFLSTAGAEIAYTAATHKEEPFGGFGSKEALTKEIGLGMQFASAGAGAKWATSPKTKAYFAEKGTQFKNTFYENVPLAKNIGAKVNDFVIRGVTKPYFERLDVRIAKGWDRFATERGLKLFESPEERYYAKARIYSKIGKIKNMPKTILGNETISGRYDYNLVGKEILGGKRESEILNRLIGKHAVYVKKENVPISSSAKSIQESTMPAKQFIKMKTKMLINPEKPYEAYFASETIGGTKRYSFGKILAKGHVANVEGFTFEESQLKDIISNKKQPKTVKYDIVAGKNVKAKISNIVSKKNVDISTVDLSDYLKTSFMDLNKEDISKELAGFWGKIVGGGGKRYTSMIQNKYVGEFEDIAGFTSKGKTKFYETEKKLIEKYAANPDKRLPYPKQMLATIKGYREIPGMAIESEALSLQKNVEMGNRYLESTMQNYDVIVSKGKFQSAGKIKGVYGEFENKIISTKPMGKENLYYGESGGFNYQSLSKDIGKHIFMPGGGFVPESKMELLYDMNAANEYVQIQGAGNISEIGKINKKDIMVNTLGATRTEINEKDIMVNTLGATHSVIKNEDTLSKILQRPVTITGTKQVQVQKQKMGKMEKSLSEVISGGANMLDTNFESPEIIEPIMPDITETTEYTTFPPLLGSKQKSRQYVSGNKKGANAYNVLVKERSMYHGKIVKPIRFKKENVVPLTKKEAVGLGATIVDNTSAVSFKVQKTEGKPSISLLPHKQFTVLEHKFKKKGNVYIEKPKYRMDQPGEITGITALGWKANKKNLVGNGKIKNVLGKKKGKGKKNVQYI